MAQVSRLAPFIRKWEGGFVNDASDHGGETNKGVTIGTYTTYRKSKGLPKPTVSDLKRMTDAEWLEIFKSMYWDKFCADSILSQSVANICVDWIWMSGVTAIKRVQKVLGVKRDGVVGPKTLSAINSVSALPLFGMIKAERKRYYDEICRKRPDNKKFLKGWMNRLNDLQFEE